MSNSPQTPAGKKKNSGYFIANDRTNDRQPQFRGKVDVEGKEYLISIWEKPPRDGKAMFSIELTDPASLPQRGAAPAAAGSPRPAQSAPPAAPRPSTPPPPGEDKAFDDIFGGDGSQW
jgi:hypothetical protein